ncbi:diacylglycerol/lipid kinase family protein [Nicoliella lavandulae]|uniref:Diacylglycerol kinase family protein n=1 Tax=Nicoliella lavandulae TaxID=3082954 RepID=A0ABU8SLN1_9LACO
MQARYLIIINPNANNGKCKDTWQLIKNQLDAGKVVYQFRLTEYHNHARLIAEQYIKKYHQDTSFQNILLVIGGDGTLNQVITGAKNIVKQDQRLHEFPIALIPAGRNNNFALEMGISLNWSQALNAALSHTNPHDINIGYYYNNFNRRYHYFLNNMGIGFESNLLNSRQKSHWKWFTNRFHRICRFWDILVNLYEIKEFPLSLVSGVNREQFSKVVWVGIYNTPYFDNNKRFMPNASIKKPSLDIMVMENKNILFVTWAIFLMFMGKRTKLKSVHYYESKSFKINIPSIEYANIDNEELGGHFYNAEFGITTFQFIY